MQPNILNTYEEGLIKEAAFKSPAPMLADILTDDGSLEFFIQEYEEVREQLNEKALALAEYLGFEDE